MNLTFKETQSMWGIGKSSEAHMASVNVTGKKTNKALKFEA